MTTVSGLSAGGYMAAQYQVAFAGEVKGIGLFAAGPWNCARGSRQLALQDCANASTSAPPVPLLLETLRALAATGAVAPTALLADDRVWIFRGTRDSRVVAPVTDALVKFYRALLMPAQITTVFAVPAGHGLPTLANAPSVACGDSAAPYLNACAYDGAGEMLQAITARNGGELDTPPTPQTDSTGPATGRLLHFDQRPYDPTGQLGPTGYLYVPELCRAAAAHCQLHIAFHGCQQGSDAIGQTFVRAAGYNRWAATYHLVVLYPQVAPSRALPFNPLGCWDWWGYTGANYTSRSAPQLAAVHAMVEALALTPER